MARTTKKYRGLVSLVLSSCLLVAVPAIAAAEEPGESAGPPRPTPPAGDVVAPTESAEAASTPVTLPPAPPPPPPGTPLFDPEDRRGRVDQDRRPHPEPVGGRQAQRHLHGHALPGGRVPRSVHALAQVAGQPGRQHYTQPADVTLDAELIVPQVGLQDLIVKFEPHDLFNVWAGKMLLPLDRANLSGPWFINFWLLRGIFPRSRRAGSGSVRHQERAVRTRPGRHGLGPGRGRPVQVLRGRVRPRQPEPERPSHVCRAPGLEPSRSGAGLLQPERLPRREGHPGDWRRWPVCRRARR